LKDNLHKSLIILTQIT